MSARGELLAKFDSETGQDLVVLLEEAMQRDLAKLSTSNAILSYGHQSELDTVSLTEKLTSSVGFFKTIGKNRSAKLADALLYIAQTETKIIEEITNRPYKLFAAYTALLRKIVDDLYHIENIKLERQKIRDQNITKRRLAMLEEAASLIKAYEEIDPELAKRARDKVAEANDIFDNEIERASSGDTFTDGEKKKAYEEALRAFIARISKI